MPDEYQPSPDVSAASGFASPGLPKDTLIQAHAGEAVAIIARQQTREMQRAGQMGGGSMSERVQVIHNHIHRDRREMANWITTQTKSQRIRVHEGSVRDFA